jgi:hypothetical protein
MKVRDRCSSRKADTGCQTADDIQTVQPFPRDGQIGNNMGLPLPLLVARLGQLKGRAFSYVVRTVEWDHGTSTFEQHGSAPNFQGDHLTLCTCKHQMRSRLSADEWEDDVWLAGFTSRTIHEGKHWLFFLAKVKSAHDSHSDLWDSVNADYRQNKSAHLHFLGDLFKPTTPKPTGHARFSASRYLMPPIHAHRQYPGDDGWKNDINYRHAVTSSHAPLLVADPRMTFLWEEPLIFFARKKHCRDYHTWSSLQRLMALLREGS